MSDPGMQKKLVTRLSNSQEEVLRSPMPYVVDVQSTTESAHKAVKGLLAKGLVMEADSGAWPFRWSVEITEAGLETIHYLNGVRAVQEVMES